MEGPSPPALGGDGLGGAEADALDAGEAVAQAEGLAVLETLGKKDGGGLVDAGREDAVAHRDSLGDEDRHLVEVAHFRGDLRAHVLRRVVGLEVPRLIGEIGVADGVRLVEGVLREGLPVLPDLVDELAGRVLAAALLHELGIGETAVDELRLHLVHHLLVLLAHRLAERVGLAAREPGQRAGEQHDLLLIDGDAVGGLEERLHHRMIVGDPLPAVLALDVLGDVLHRPGPVERVHRHEIFDPVGLKRAQMLLHPVGFELEESRRVAPREDGEGLGVVERNRLDVHRLAARLLDARQALLEHGQRLEPQEVHLEQPDRLHEMTVVLRAEQRVLVRGFDGDGLGERIAADDDAAGVHADLAHGAVEFLHDAEDAARHLGAVLEFVAQVGAGLERVVERGLGAVGDEAGEAVRLGDVDVEGARDVLDADLGRHRAEGDDVRDVVGAVLVHDPGEDAIAPGVVEVHVDVRHRDAVGIQEALEEQVVGDGVDVGDPQAVGDDAPGGGTSAGADDDAHLACGGDEVLHDEEVAGKAHVADGLQLEAQALLDFRRHAAGPAALRPGAREVLEVVRLVLDAPQPLEAAGRVAAQRLELLAEGLPQRHLLGARRVFGEVRGNREDRHDGLRFERVLLDLRGEVERVCERLGMLREEGGHLLRRLEPLLPRVAQAPRVAVLLARVDAEQDVVRVRVLLHEIVDVVRRDDLDAEVCTEAEDLLVHPQLAGVDLLVDRRGDLRSEAFVGLV